MAEKKEAAEQEAATGFNASEFLRGTKEELDKVVWPSRQQLVSESLAVLLMITLSATLIYFVGQFFDWVADKVF